MKFSDYISDKNLGSMSEESLNAAIDAISQILAARSSAGSSGGGGGSPTGGEVEIDPELDIPTDFDMEDDGDMGDFDIDDPDHVLDDMKQREQNHRSNSNKGEYSNKNDIEGNTETDSAKEQTDADKSKNSGNSTSNAVNANDTEEADNDAEDSNTTAEDESNGIEDDTSEDSNDDDYSEDDDEEYEEADEDDKDYADYEDDDALDDDTTSDSEDDEEDDDIEWDDDEFGPIIDDEHEFDFRDDEEKRLAQQRGFQKNRTERLGQKTLDYGKAHGATEYQLQELSKALEELQKLDNKQLGKIDEKTFNKAISRVLDACDTIHKVSFTPDVEARVQQIKDDVESGSMEAELSAEDQKVAATGSGLKARTGEIGRYKPKPLSSFKLNFYRTIKDQVAYQHNRVDSWTQPNKRGSEGGILRPGQTTNREKDKDIPTVDVYIDQSGSWDEKDVTNATRAIQVVSDFENKGEITVNIYYFSNNLHTDAASARAEGGTSAWPQIVENIVNTKAKNVVLITDTDMDYACERNPAITVPGYVWFIWKNQYSVSYKLPQRLRGKAGSSQYTLYSN